MKSNLGVGTPVVEVTEDCGASIMGTQKKTSVFYKTVCVINHQANSLVSDTNFEVQTTIKDYIFPIFIDNEYVRLTLFNLLIFCSKEKHKFNNVL